MRPELGTLDMLLAQAAVPDPRLRLDAEQFASRLGAVVSDYRAVWCSRRSLREVPLLSAVPPVGAAQLDWLSTSVTRPDHRGDAPSSRR